MAPVDLDGRHQMTIDKPTFLFMYEQEDFKTLTDATQAGLTDVLTFLENDPYLTDRRKIAYCLATTLHETAGEWIPLEEYGKGKGHPYGTPDKRTGQIYYGRGYIQCTWYDNYLMLTAAWNKANPTATVDFTTHPEMMCIPEYAYWAMSYGMRNGSYTGVGLSRYFNDTVTDPVNARRIINGTDCAARIAGYYDKFVHILTATLGA
jgi:hypothetical protein